MIINSITMTCDFCPTQYEFTTECGREGYIRYRDGYFFVYLSEPNQKVQYEPWETIIWFNFNNPYHGTMSEERVYSLLKGYGFEIRGE